MSIADEIMKLDALRKQGAITDEEFEQQKQALLSRGAPKAASVTEYSDWSQVPVKNKWWFQWLITLLVIPAGLVLMAFLKAFRKKKDGEIVRVGVGFKAVFATMVLALWGMGIASLFGGAAPQEVARCDSAEARALLASAIEQNAYSNIATLRLLDVRDAQEVSYDESAAVRRCNATLVLNSGSEFLGYTLSRTSDGRLLVETAPEPFTVEAPSEKEAGMQEGTSAPAPQQAAQVTEPPAVERPAREFSDYHEEIYTGPVVWPRFDRPSHRQFAPYQTQIGDAINAGINFGGHYTIAEIGCGTGCRLVYIVDVQLGDVTEFSREEYAYLQLEYTPNSRLLRARWEEESEDSGATTCVSEDFEYYTSGHRSLGQTRSAGSCE